MCFVFFFTVKIKSKLFTIAVLRSTTKILRILRKIQQGHVSPRPPLLDTLILTGQMQFV